MRWPGCRVSDKKVCTVDGANVLANGRVEEHVSEGVWGGPGA